MSISSESSISSTNHSHPLRVRFAKFMLAQLVNNATVRVSCQDSLQTFSINHGEQQHYHMELESLPILWDLLSRPDPGFGEAYIENRWRLLEGDLGAFLTMLARGRKLLLPTWRGKLLRHFLQQNPPHYQHDVKTSYGLIQHHYDLGNTLYQSFLDTGMNYSCAFFESPSQSLRDAQLNKLHTALDRLDIKPGMEVLDIGCGWGETCLLASDRAGIPATGITLAENQIDFARNRISDQGHSPQFLLRDYREHANTHSALYDRIISIGMVEHVGEENIDTYFRSIAHMLAPEGRALVHSIVSTDGEPGAELSSPWLIKYIFPGGHIPGIRRLQQAANKNGLRLVAEPYRHDSFNYAETLRRWRTNFLNNYSQLDRDKYDARFKRMWLFYLCMCEAMFESRHCMVAQLVVEK